MYVHPDSATNEALIEALYSSAREIGKHVLFDWDNDDLFSHEYSDLSAVVLDAQHERASLTTDLPENVNTIQGYSSSELTLSLKGARDSEELPMSRLLSPFDTGSPFYNRDLTGTTVRYWLRVYTEYGEVDIRQFTGVVRDLQFNRKDQTVQIICSDVMQWLNRAVTLRPWAVDLEPNSLAVAGAGRYINASWVLAEVLRQCGTPIGPLERSDAVWSVSGCGSFLPSVSGPMILGSVANFPHVLPTTEFLGDPWRFGKYGLCMNPTNTVNGERGTARSAASTEAVHLFPSTNISGAPKNIGFNAWAESTGSTTTQTWNTATGFGTGLGSSFGMDPWRSNNGVGIGIANNGQVRAEIYVYRNASSSQQVYAWEWNVKQSAGWHYYDVNFRFTNGSMDVVLTVDGTVIAPTSGGLVSQGFEYYEGGYRAGSDYWRHPANLVVYDPSQWFQFYINDATNGVYQPGQEHPPTTKDGIPWVLFGGCQADMSFIPDVWNTPAWEVLQKIATAEFAAMYVNEYGQLVFKNHELLRLQTPTVPDASYTVDNLLGMIVNPSLDQYKNEIILPYVNKKSVIDDVWQPDTGRQFVVEQNWANSNSAGGWQFSPSYRIDNVAALVYHIVPTSGYNDLQKGWDEWTHTYNSYAAACFAQSIDRDCMYPDHSDLLTTWGGYEGVAMPSNDMRFFQLWMRALDYTPNQAWSQILFGAAAITYQPNQPVPNDPGIFFSLKGKKVVEDVTGYYSVSDSAAIADRGRFSLILDENEWRQTINTATSVSTQLLSDTITPAPVIEDLQLPLDPRLQILDVIGLTPEDGISGSITAQIVGLRTNAKAGTMSLDVRITKTPSKWALGVPGASELGQTTYLN
ncbi:hypothetical protein [Amycolatopsis anabasis]|uniref:hypothetical protein n=1 Tax=Amycolatopsis anabasis TaxID=1840409 RepID=UPI00131A890A|nr:hypothetical protein [Amycolatopsis anabasis]